MYEISRLVLGAYQANCYLLGSGAQVLVIDPGAEPELVLSAVGDRRVVGIVATHCHSDHIGAINELVQATGGPVLVGRQDVAAMADPHLSGFDEEGLDYRVSTVDRPLVEGDQVCLGSDTLAVLETPGHTPGSICLLDEANQILFTGDTLFESGIGRTDFVRGNAADMRATLLRLGRLSADLSVLPGHGAPTTIGRERRRNPLLGGAR
ncbi:MAG: MBL fold metallo-hydrolase [Brooklawnia sp.]|nr:MBL fold metallo-hydrolase [Brooklawnia sp.]